MKTPYIIVAAGKGRRMSSFIPKQYIEVAGKPVIYYTVKKLYEIGIRKFIIVIDLSYQEYIEKFLREFEAQIKYVVGGERRQESVINGLSKIANSEDIAAIHDSVRPFVTKKMIKTLEDKMTDGAISCAIPVLPIKDTAKKVEDGLIIETINREKLVGVGTPQYIRVKDYLEALKILKDKNIVFTDDASVLENANFTVVAVDGDSRCFKITEPYDLKKFEYIIKEEICE